MLLRGLKSPLHFAIHEVPWQTPIFTLLVVPKREGTLTSFIEISLEAGALLQGIVRRAKASDSERPSVSDGSPGLRLLFGLQPFARLQDDSERSNAAGSVKTASVVKRARVCSAGRPNKQGWPSRGAAPGDFATSSRLS
jgi:hypothetical protein